MLSSWVSLLALKGRKFLFLENLWFCRFGQKFSGERPVSLPRGSPKITNFQFTPQNRGDLFRPDLAGDQDKMIVRFEIINAGNTSPKDVFKPGEYNLAKDDKNQRFYSLNVIRSKNNSTESVRLKNYKDARITITSVTDEEVAGTYDIRFAAIGDNQTEDENAHAKGSFKAKFWEEK